MTTPTAHIYVCHHKPGSSFSDDTFLPIQVGAAASKYDLGLQRDDAGDNISLRNPTFCELTAIYWAWKNDRDAEWVGLMHYRRFLDFTLAEHELDAHGHVNFDELDDTTRESLGLTGTAIRQLLTSRPGLKAVLPREWSVDAAGSRSLRHHYVTAPHHFESDLELLRQVVAERHPDDLESFDKVLAGRSGYFTNIFVLRRDLFDQYCEWLFDILFEVEKRLDMTNYSTAARRVFGYMSERLFNVFVKKYITNDPAAFVEAERVFVRDTTKGHVHVPLEPLADNAVSIVTVADGNFVPHLAAFIASVQDNLSTDRLLDLIVLDGGIPADQQRLLSKQFNRSGKGRLSFIQCAHLFSDIPLHGPFSAATFYRLSLGELLAKHKRVVYVDSDTVVLGDLRELYDLDLGGKAVAAVPDVIMKSFVSSGVPALKEAGGAPAGIYLKERVGMGSRGDEYFQAGLIVIDLDEFRRLRIGEDAYKDLLARRYWFLDQDVLNKHLLGHVKFLDLSWNVVNASMDVLSGLETDVAAKVKEVFAAPSMVHYAGHEAKPWNRPTAPLAHFYWYYLRRTYWYESVIDRRPISPTLDAELQRSRLYKRLRGIWRRTPGFVQRRLFWLRDRMM